MRATTVITRVFAKFEELLDIHVPGFEVSTDGAFSLAALIDGHCRIVDDLEEGNNTLALTIGALDISA